MTAIWQPEREATRLRNGTVAVVGASTVDLTIDGVTVAGVPVYGAMPVVGDRVLVAEQGAGLLVVTPGGAGGGGVTDHGALTGLGDDDHPQYHTDARGDARYQPLSQQDTGYRNISTMLGNGWAAAAGGYALLRRCERICHLALYNVETPAVWNATAIPTRLPLGFRPTQAGLGQGARGTGGAYRASDLAAANVVMAANDFSTNGCRFYTTGLTGAVVVTGGKVAIIAECWYFTDEAWPTSLPGAPVVAGKFAGGGEA